MQRQGSFSEAEYAGKKKQTRRDKFLSEMERVGWVSGRVARPFGFALTDPGRRLSRTRLFPEVTRIAPRLVSKGG
jgi:hypothetical protein